MQKITAKSLVDVVANDGRIIIVVGPMCWGRHRHAATALKNARSRRPSFVSVKEARYNVFDVPADAWVDDMGTIRWEDGKQKHVELGTV